jgi:hypothetical protein
MMAVELEEREAKDLGLMVSLCGLLDDDVELAETLKKGHFPQLPQGKVKRIEDLAAFDKDDWLAVLTQANTKPPKGLNRKEYAALLTKKVENLYPSRALLARMKLKETKGLSEGIERLQPLFDKNEALFGADWFDSLDVEGIDPGEVEELRQTHTRLKRFANAYPGLRLGEILDNRQLSPPADKAARIAERVELLSRFQAQNPDVEFLRLDYAPDSDDIKALDFTGFSADEQRMVLSTVKAYQRMYSVTNDGAHAKLLLEMGYHSPLSIADVSLKHFVVRTSLDETVAEKYYDNARVLATRTTLNMDKVLDPADYERGIGHQLSAS